MILRSKYEVLDKVVLVPKNNAADFTYEFEQDYEYGLYRNEYVFPADSFELTVEYKTKESYKKLLSIVGPERIDEVIELTKEL